MGHHHTYFTIPFDKVPTGSNCTIWYAAWSTERPAVGSSTPPPFAVGVTTGELPVEATLLGATEKDPIPPPAPPSPTAVSLTDYQQTVTQWLADGRALDTRYKYFAIPFDKVPQTPPYTVWFATWSNDRPMVASGTHPPHVVGVTRGALPAEAHALATFEKDPIPPPAPPVPGTISLADYRRSVTQWFTEGRSL